MVYLINPKSGGGIGQKLLQTTGLKHLICIDPPNISQQILDHVRPGEGLAIAGGDGTFSLVINTLFQLEWQDQVSLYLFPTGTGNDLARSLGIPKMTTLPTSAEAWQAITPKKSAIPIWRYGDYYFVNYLSWGMDAKMLSEVEHYRRLFPGNVGLRKIAFTLAGIQHIDYYVSSPSQIIIDDTVHNLQKKAGVIISNLPYYLGGSRISTLAPEDPQLSITFVNHVRDLIRLGFSRNLPRKAPILPFLTANKVQLIGPDLPMQIDGEVGIYAETSIEYAGTISIWT